MKYTGRILGSFLFLANALIWIYHQEDFHHETQVGSFEIVFSFALIVTGWWAGMFFDKSNYQSKILEDLSNRDGLTGVGNRRYFDRHIVLEWQKAIHNKKTISFILFDVDYFKEFNDTYGHLLGDDSLKAVAASIQCTTGKQIVARFGGEEFAVILPGASYYHASSVAEQIRTKVESIKIPHSSSKYHYLTVSCGVSSITPDKKSNLMHFINSADQALYQSKQNGRNRIISIDLDHQGSFSQKSSDYHYG